MKVYKGLKDDYKKIMCNIYYHPILKPVVLRTNNIAGSIVGICGLACLAILFLVVLCGCVQADEVDIDRLATAIYHAEGGSKTKHPYGILTKYKITTPRQACINTINTNLRKFKAQNKEKDFIVFMSKTYCPIGAKNDPTGLNKNWVKNVKFYYNKALSKGAK